MRSKRRFLYALVAASILLPGKNQVVAGEAASRGSLVDTLYLTIDQSIVLGLENSRSLHSSLMKVAAADAKASEVNTSRLPSLKFGGSYTRLSEVPPSTIGPIPGLIPNPVTISQSIYDNYNLKFSLQQPLFTGFRLENSFSLAKYNVKATEQDYAKDKADLVYNIKNAYWSLYKAIEVKKVIDENVEQMQAHLRDVQNLYDQGLVTKNEVLKIEVQLSDAKLRQIDSEHNVRLSTIALNNTIGQLLNSPVILKTTIIHQPREIGELDALVQQAIEKRPEMKGIDYRVKASEAGVSFARGGWFPQIYLVGNYYYARPNQRIFPAVDRFKDTWDVGVAVSFDIWNWGQTIHQTDQAQAQLAQAEDARQQLRDGITLEVTQSSLNVGIADERIAVAEKGVQQAEENYRITDEKFKSGLASNSDLLDAEVALLQTKWNAIQALVDYELSVARLERAIGREQ